MNYHSSKNRLDVEIGNILNENKFFILVIKRLLENSSENLKIQKEKEYTDDEIELSEYLKITIAAFTTIYSRIEQNNQV